nr:M15 family metallopeptidase [Arthrobacter stackebrandtii]
MLLRAEAAAELERMFTDAAAEGVSISLKSSYRSYDTQFSVYNGYVATKGVAAADTTSARPGYSEHQSGLAVDIGDANAGTACDFNSCFADTAAAQWVAEHGADYGYIVRYQPGQEPMTGYLPEPWHLRFVGPAVAKEMAVRGYHSYEEFLDISGAPDY